MIGYNNKDSIATLFDIFPAKIVKLLQNIDNEKLIEVICDIDRPLIARYLDGSEIELAYTITAKDLQAISTNRLLTAFTANNRCGIDKTLHRIACIRGKDGQSILGLTIRIGRILTPQIDLIADIIDTGESVLFLGKPAAGKTTKLRECADYLSTEGGKRVIIIDSCNEIGGEGNVPHFAVGRARRMPIPQGKKQYEIMLEAVESHNPQVLIIDEISTREEAMACKTIGERGIQLLASAHGERIENLIKNPAINTIIGGAASVTVGDKEASKTGNKVVLKREFMPVFSHIIELTSYKEVQIHSNLEKAVDMFFNGSKFNPEVRISR